MTRVLRGVISILKLKDHSFLLILNAGNCTQRFCSRLQSFYLNFMMDYWPTQMISASSSDTVERCSYILNQFDTAALALHHGRHVLYGQGVVEWITTSIRENMITWNCSQIYYLGSTRLLHSKQSIFIPATILKFSRKT